MASVTKTDFKPATPWPWLTTLAGTLNQLVIGRHTRLDVRSGDIELLQHLPPGCLIAPNHSHYYDAQVTFEMTRRARRRVTYMATRELFDAYRGLAGLLYQRLGVFSVNRGGMNDQARAFAVKVLVTGTRDLLMFPEGEVYLLNDLVMPLKPGVARLALEAASKLARESRSRPVLIVPMAIKYQYVEDIALALQRLASRLEEKVFGQARRGVLYPRIVAIGTVLVSRAELAQGIIPVPGDDLFERIERLRRILLERLEQTHLGQVQQGPHLTRARRLMIRIQGSMLTAAGGDGYFGSPAVQSQDPLAPDLEAARLCARSVSFQKDYLLQDPTAERMAETLVKIEREVLGTETRTFGRRRAIIRVCEPLDAATCLPQYESSPEDAIDAVVVQIHKSLQSQLDAIADHVDAA